MNMNIFVIWISAARDIESVSKDAVGKSPLAPFIAFVVFVIYFSHYVSMFHTL